MTALLANVSDTGKTDVLCVDRTGTTTCNRLEVAAITVGSRRPTLCLARAYLLNSNLTAVGDATSLGALGCSMAAHGHLELLQTCTIDRAHRLHKPELRVQLREIVCGIVRFTITGRSRHRSARGPPRTAAVFIASLASSASGCSDIGQASSQHLHRSSTEEELALLGGDLVMSPHHLRSGAGAVRSRFNRSGNFAAFLSVGSIPCSAPVSDLAGPAGTWTRRRCSH